LPQPQQPAANVKNLPDQLLTIKASTMKEQYGEWVGALAQGALGTQLHCTALRQSCPEVLRQSNN